MAPKAPSNMKAKGRRLWSDVVGTYTLRPDELLVLEHACREADLCDRIQTALDDGDLTVKGSMGQVVASPLVQELRQHRAVFARLVAQLKLPDDANPSGARMDGDTARSAAESRWRSGA